MITDKMFIWGKNTQNTRNSPHGRAVEVHKQPLVRIKVEGVSKLKKITNIHLVNMIF